MKNRWKLAVVAVVVTAVGAFGLSVGVAQSPPASDGDAELSRQAATRPATRVLSTNDVQIIGIWRNGQGHIVRMPARRVLVNTDVVPVERGEPTVPNPQAFIESQLPAPRPGLDPRLDVPTPEQWAAFQAQMAAANLEANPWMREANKNLPIPDVRPGG